jgi:hypothetical protein
MMGREQFTVDINCPHCAQPGAVVWEENTIGNRVHGIQRALIRVSDGFHPETARTESGDPLLVCDKCNTIQPD